MASQLDWMAERRIQQAVTQGKKEIEGIALEIIKQATEKIYKAPCCLVRNVG